MNIKKSCKIIKDDEVVKEQKNNDKFADEITKSLNRFLNNEWGVVSQEEKEKNDEEARNDKTGVVVAYYPTSKGMIQVVLEMSKSEIKVQFV